MRSMPMIAGTVRWWMSPTVTAAAPRAPAPTTAIATAVAMMVVESVRRCPGVVPAHRRARRTFPPSVHRWGSCSMIMLASGAGDGRARDHRGGVHGLVGRVVREHPERPRRALVAVEGQAPAGADVLYPPPVGQRHTALGVRVRHGRARRGRRHPRDVRPVV